MAEGISNDRMEEIYIAAKAAGATGGKISGAGGGGFMIFYCPGNTKFKVMEKLNSFGGHCKNLSVCGSWSDHLDYLKLIAYAVRILKKLSALP